MAKREPINSIHPGEILLEEFLNPMAISQYRLARDIHVPARRFNEIANGKRTITLIPHYAKPVTSATAPSSGVSSRTPMN